jgi:hypothetical protein
VQSQRLAIRFVPSIWLWAGHAADLRVSVLPWVSGHRALQEPVEKQAAVARVAAVEAEGE